MLHHQKTCFSAHYENMPHVIYRFFLIKLKIENFHWKICDVFNIFAQNIDCVYMIQNLCFGTHNLCIGVKIRKIGIPLHTPVLLYKSGVQGGIHYTDMFS